MKKIDLFVLVILILQSVPILAYCGDEGIDSYIADCSQLPVNAQGKIVDDEGNEYSCSQFCDSTQKKKCRVEIVNNEPKCLAYTATGSDCPDCPDWSATSTSTAPSAIPEYNNTHLITMVGIVAIVAVAFVVLKKKK